MSDPAMNIWLDTSKSVRAKPLVQYLPPTNANFVKELVEKIFAEEKRASRLRAAWEARRLDYLKRLSDKVPEQS